MSLIHKKTRVEIPQEQAEVFRLTLKVEVVEPRSLFLKDGLLKLLYREKYPFATRPIKKLVISIPIMDEFFHPLLYPRKKSILCFIPG